MKNNGIDDVDIPKTEIIGEITDDEPESYDNVLEFRLHYVPLVSEIPKDDVYRWWMFWGACMVSFILAFYLMAVKVMFDLFAPLPFSWDEFYVFIIVNLLMIATALGFIAHIYHEKAAQVLERKQTED